jgi:hypothetical protein
VEALAACSSPESFPTTQTSHDYRKRWPLRIFEQLFPGFHNELLLRGTTVIRHAYRNIAWRNGERATALVAGSNSAVSGVHRSSGALLGDLVIDTSGRNSRTPQWLADVGFPAPAESVVNAQWGCVSRIDRRPASTDANWKAVLSMPNPPDHFTVGIMQPGKTGNGLVTLAGVNGHHPPIDENGFLEFARGLRTPLIHFNTWRSAAPPISVGITSALIYGLKVSLFWVTRSEPSIRFTGRA